MMIETLTKEVETVQGEIVNEISQTVTEDFLQGRCEFNTDAEIIADWLQSKSNKTAKTYFSTIKQFQQFTNNTPISNWSKKLILAYLEQLKGKNKVATINKKLTTLRSLLHHCVREGYLTRNVASTIATVKEDKENIENQSATATERIIGSDKVWDLINSATNQRDRLILKTTYLLGLRAHEAVKIHWNDITPSGNGYKLKIIGKNNKTAFLPIDNGLIRELKQISTSGYIFKSRKGKTKMSTVQLHRIIKTSARKANITEEVSAHWLRHQRCSDLVNSGKYTLSQVQKFMRHNSPNITSQYVHVDNEIGSDALT